MPPDALSAMKQMCIAARGSRRRSGQEMNAYDRYSGKRSDIQTF